MRQKMRRSCKCPETCDMFFCSKIYRQRHLHAAKWLHPCRIQIYVCYLCFLYYITPPKVSQLSTTVLPLNKDKFLCLQCNTALLCLDVVYFCSVVFILLRLLPVYVVHDATITLMGNRIPQVFLKQHNLVRYI